MTPQLQQLASQAGKISSAGTAARPAKRVRERGAALLAAMCFATVLALGLGSYITVCYRTLEMSTRTLQGTRGAALAELGLEEALWALNHDNWDGWTIEGTTATKTLSRLAFDSGTTGSVALRIANYTGTTGPRTVTVTGTAREADGTTVSRTLTSSSSKAPLFVNAVAGTTGRVRFRAAGTVDSYDSTRGDYASQTPGYSAIISSASTSTSASNAAVQLTNAQVKGHVATLGSPPSYSSSGRLVGPSTPEKLKIDPARVSSSPYQPIFDELVPSGTGTVLPVGSATLGTPGASAPELYYATELILNGSQSLTIDGPVVIVVSGDVYIRDSAKIRIKSTGSLRIHVDGDLAINGDGIQNDTKLPKKLFIVSTSNPWESYGMATNTPFYGVIYTPKSSLTVSNDQAIYGAIIAKAVTFTGSPAIHYDVSLRNEVLDGVVTPFSVTNWRESIGD